LLASKYPINNDPGRC